MFAITPDYIIAIKPQLIDSVSDDIFKNYLINISGREIILPEKFAPDVELLARHYENYNKI